MSVNIKGEAEKIAACITLFQSAFVLSHPVPGPGIMQQMLDETGNLVESLLSDLRVRLRDEVLQEIHATNEALSALRGEAK